MAKQPEGPAEEIKRLQRCISDLVSVLALPAMWTGSAPPTIIANLLNALVSMLNLDFIYARLSDSSDAAGFTEMVRTGSTWEPKPPAQEVGEKLQPWLGDDPQKLPQVVNDFFGEGHVALVPLQLGLRGEMGVIIAGSRRADFPQQTERLVLNVGANQAAIGLQEANLLSELDQRVAARTAELAAANEELKGEIADRKEKEAKLRLSEEALRGAHIQIIRSEERWRSVFENSAIGVALTDLNGRFIATNPVYQTMLGYTEQELVQLSFLDLTVEEDRNLNWGLVVELLEGKRRQFQIEKRYRRKNGSLVWVRNSVSVVPGTERVPRFLMALSEDVTEQHDSRATLEKAFDEIKKSETKMRQVVDAIPTLAWCNLPDGGNEFLNKSWHEYTGLAPEESQGWGWQVTFHPDDLPPLMERWKELLASGEPGEIEARLRRHDGVYRWFLIRVQPFRDERGEIIRWYGTSTDIDDRKRAEHRLRRNEEVLAKGQRLSLTGSFSWCVDTNEIIFSDEAYRIFEFERGAPVTVERITDRVHREDLRLLADRNEQPRGPGGAHDYEIRLCMPNGSVKYLRTISSDTRDVYGRREYIGAIQDVTERRHTEDALNKARSELAHVARISTLSALTASIAHEVNQPLSGIVTNASTCLRMLDANPPNLEGARETARRTIRDGNRASEVVTRLRALFSKKSGAVEAFDLNEAAREVIVLSLSELQRNRVVLQQDFAADLPSVSGDRIQIQQVILNLMRNGSDAMSSIHDRPRQLLIWTEREQSGGVRLTVRDVGVGIDPQTREKLFEAFYTTKSDGMGMGLSVSLSIIESHRGRLWAMPNEGPGATFAFSIPCSTNTKV